VINIKNILFVSIIILSGCFHDNESDSILRSCETENSDIQGCWKTQECFQAGAIDDGGVDVWLRSEYEFTPEGDINFIAYKFYDSSCSGNFESAIDISELPIIKYVVKDNIVSESGIEGTDVAITMGPENDIVTINGVIVITESDELCTSSSIYLGPEKIFLSEGGGAKDTDLFENCLVRGKLP